ncbi:MAG: GAF domain-containing protein [Acidobacteria bacterium]|nr:GAF domain-containing protein [Acidobacteriota bacterium]
MAVLALKALLSQRSGVLPVVQALVEALGGNIAIEDAGGKLLFGEATAGPSRFPVSVEDEVLGWVSGSAEAAASIVSLLGHLAAKELERRALAGEVLHLYREVHLIGQLSEELAAVLDAADVGQAALEQALRLIPGTHAGILFREDLDGPLRPLGTHDAPLAPESRFVASVLERGVAEIVNDYPADGRALAEESSLRSLISAPLLTKQRTIGLITLADTGGAPYSAAHLKLLNTIAMQTAAAIENAIASQQLLHREVERQALKLYLPPQVADLIVSSGGTSQLAGVLQPITVLYADIRGFTTMSEEMEARDIVQLLNEFFTAMSGVIFQCNGTLDKFIGDCIMALFGAPVPSERAAQDALDAAMGMQQALMVLNQSRIERNLRPFQIGIGLHCGLAVVGNIGSADRVQYTAIGDTVNVAARLVNKAAGGQIIVSEAIRESLPDFAGFDALGEVDLKGRASKMNIYSVRD